MKSCTKLAPAWSFSRASSGECMPPTPMIGKLWPLFSAKKRITSVERLVKGLPLRPPVSTLLGDANPSLLMVVLVAMTPAMEVCFTMSIISNSCSSVRSGAIFSNIGLGLGSFPLASCKSVSSFCSGSFLVENAD